jgi:hypothetical protein
MLIPAADCGARLFVAPLPIALPSAMIRRATLAHPQPQEQIRNVEIQSQDHAQTTANPQQMAASPEADPQEMENLMRSA